MQPPLRRRGPPSLHLNRVSLLGEVLRGSRMIRDGGDRRCEVEVELMALVVALGDGVLVVEDRAHDIVDRILGYVVAGDDDGTDGDGLAVFGRAVDRCVDGVRRVVRGCRQQCIHVLVVDGHEMDLVRGGEGGDRNGRGACHDERGVDLAVLQGIDAVAEALVCRVDVVLSKAVGRQDVEGVVVDSSGSTDRG